VVDGWDSAKPGAIGTKNFDVTMDLDGSNAVTNRRMFGAGFDEGVARRDSVGTVSWSGVDGLGSVRQLFDNSGNVQGSRSYTGFGAVTTTTGTGHDRYGFAGTTTDAFTGLNGDDARLYDPNLGRWTSEDPIGFAGGNANLSRYVGNAVTMYSDPSGLAIPISIPADDGTLTPVPRPANVPAPPPANGDSLFMETVKNLSVM
jgi:RHS repeat-associated protein